MGRSQNFSLLACISKESNILVMKCDFHRFFLRPAIGVILECFIRYLLSASCRQDSVKGQFNVESPSACTQATSQNEPTHIGFAGIGFTTDPTILVQWGSYCRARLFSRTGHLCFCWGGGIGGYFGGSCALPEDRDN